ncbi:MAG: hypothetical protein KJZ93_25755 [Caldilineaceae bacterium]|nr:hypothetical protein [Caldilineaceae bacterium]
MDTTENRSHLYTPQAPLSNLSICGKKELQYTTTLWPEIQTHIAKCTFSRGPDPLIRAVLTLLDPECIAARGLFCHFFSIYPAIALKTGLCAEAHPSSNSGFQTGRGMAKGIQLHVITAAIY